MHTDDAATNTLGGAASGHHADSARPAADGEREELRVIGFRIGEHRFAASVAAIETVLAPPVLARVPRAVAWLTGVWNWHGRVLPLIDLRRYAGGTETQVTAEARVLVMAGRAQACGFLVAEVFGLLELDAAPNDVSRAERESYGELDACITGRIEHDGRSYAVLALEQLSNVTDLAANARAENNAQVRTL